MFSWDDVKCGFCLEMGQNGIEGCHGDTFPKYSTETHELAATPLGGHGSQVECGARLVQGWGFLWLQEYFLRWWVGHGAAGTPPAPSIFQLVECILSRAGLPGPGGPQWAVTPLSSPSLAQWYDLHNYHWNLGSGNSTWFSLWKALWWPSQLLELSMHLRIQPMWETHSRPITHEAR